MGRRYLRRIRDNRADKSRARLGGSARARPFMDSFGYVNVRASHEGCAAYWTLSNAAPASDTELDEAMDKLRQELISAGHSAQVPASMKALN